MELAKLQYLLSHVTGCTLASIDVETVPSPGMRKTVSEEVVLLYNNVHLSVYEKMVRERLSDLGKDPDTFQVQVLSWGERIAQGGPILVHHGKYYLQTILVKEGNMSAFIGTREVDPKILGDVFLRDKAIRDAAIRQDLPTQKAVIVRTYKLESIRAIRLQDKAVAA